MEHRSRISKFEKVTFDLSRFQKKEPVEGEKKARPKNEFYELCKFFADIYNASLEKGGKEVTPQRFMRDCKKNRRAYELAQMDFHEISTMPQFSHEYKTPKAKAVLLFGRLKNRKVN